MPGVGRGITRANPRFLRSRVAGPHESPGPPSAAPPSQTTQGAEFEIVSAAIGTAAVWLGGAHDSAETPEPAADHAGRADALATLGCPAAPAAGPPGVLGWRREGLARAVAAKRRRLGPWREHSCQALVPRRQPRDLPPHHRSTSHPTSSPPITPHITTHLDHHPHRQPPLQPLPPIIPTSAAPHTWHSRSEQAALLVARPSGRLDFRRFSARLEPACTDAPSRGVPLILRSPAVRARFQIRGRLDAIATART
jgi:hypothetical protein